MTNNFGKCPKYPDDHDYTTNAPSYYDDLARKSKLIQLLSERIWEYDEELAKRFEAWDQNLEEFDDEVLKLLQEWINDGTMDHIINEEIFSWKADKTELDAVQALLNAEIDGLKTTKADQTALNALDDTKADQTDLDQMEYDLMESVQTLENNTNTELTNIVKHRPIHVGTAQPSASIGNNGDLYLQLYSGNTFFYEQGTFIPYLAGVNTEQLDINYSTQSAHYSKVGNQVHVTLRIVVDSIGSLPDETLFVRGIPYSSLDTQMFTFSGEIRNTGLTERYISSLFSNNESNGYFNLRYTTNLYGNNYNTYRTSDLVSGFNLFLSFSYLSTETAIPLLNISKTVMK